MKCGCLVRRMAVLALMCAIPAAASSLEHELNQQHRGNAYVLRHFYRSNTLHYAADGTLISASDEAPWTVARVKIKKIKVGNKTVRVEGLRAGDLFDSKTGRLHTVVVPTDVPVEIEVDLAPGAATEPDIQKILGRIFIINPAEIADEVPYFWKRFFANASYDPESREWILPSVEKPTPIAESGKASFVRELGPSGNTVFRVGGPVSAPKVTKNPDPEYEPLARPGKVQGTCVLLLVVGSQGKIDYIQVVRPIGFGLDDRAVQAVAGWQFKPAMYKGEPVPVQIHVEVRFRLY